MQLLYTLWQFKVHAGFKNDLFWYPLIFRQTMESVSIGSRVNIKRERYYFTLLFHLTLGEHGLHRSDLVNWYLGEVEEDIQSEQELIDTKLLVEMVIDRLVKHVSFYKEQLVVLKKDSQKKKTTKRQQSYY